ncbi:hypothetical protein HanRHA438_Chr17g0789991 [Helianthus annuus]|nr:hypothetical protein HanRHA438_Chr17g0789991 [Helianthus annuus]
MRTKLGASLTSRRLIPKRGQIMVRIVATAYHSVASVFLKLPHTTTTFPVASHT